MVVFIIKETKTEKSTSFTRVIGGSRKTYWKLYFSQKKMMKRDLFCTSWNLNNIHCWLKSTGMTKISYNVPKFCSRWNKRVAHSDLHTGTIFSDRFGRKRTKFKTLVVNYVTNCCQLVHRSLIALDPQYYLWCLPERGLMPLVPS